MKLNSRMKIISKNVLLVPYRKHHVPKYHEWMKSEELQILTASEPLTLEEEYKMQETWRDDDDKCTFIILEKDLYTNNSDEIGSMIGDTNIFLKQENGIYVTGEIEIMIAETSARGKKLGWEAVILMLLYGIQHIGLKHFEAKISTQNTTSINMFSKLGFSETSRSEVFQELTLERAVESGWEIWLSQQYPYTIEPH